MPITTNTTATTPVHCNRCSTIIDHPDLAAFWFAIDDVPSGPLCHRCWCESQICDSCHHTFKTTPTEHGAKFYEEVGMNLCLECARTKLGECDGCHKLSALSEIEGFGKLCASCASGIYKCKECNTNKIGSTNWLLVREDSLLHLRYQGVFRKYNDGLCKDCFEGMKHRFKYYEVYKCPRCEGHTSNTQEGGSHYCDKCMRTSNVKWCSLCNTFHHTGSTPYSLTPYVEEVSVGGGTAGGASISASTYFADLEREVFATTLAAEEEYEDYDEDEDEREGEAPPRPAAPESGTLYACGKCMQTRFLCVGCRMLHLKSEAHGLLKNMCKGCHTKSVICSDCCQPVVNYVTLKDHTNSDVKVCHKCNADPSRVCRSCKGHIHSLKVSNEGGYCRKCQLERGSYPVWSYSVKPPLFIHSKGCNSALLFGFENEISFGTSEYDKATIQILQHYPAHLLYAKRDSSVNSGNEFITSPMDYPFFNRVDWSNMFAYGSPRKHSSTGMHVHLSKGAFTTFHLYKFMNFLYQNKSFVETIAGRTANSYCTNFPNYGLVKHAAKHKDTSGRHFINMNSSKTIELRFFAGVIAEDMLRKNIEFSVSLFYFTLNNPNTKVGLVDYLSFVNKHKKEYPNLAAFITGLSLTVV